jgi:hypothetical protein
VRHPALPARPRPPHVLRAKSRRSFTIFAPKSFPLLPNRCFARQIAGQNPQILPKLTSQTLTSKPAAGAMGSKSKRTSAPAPTEIPPQQPPPVPPYGPGSWFPTPPTQSTSSAPWWLAGHQQLGLAGSSTQGSSWVQTASASFCPVTGNDDDSEVQVWYVSSNASESLSVSFYLLRSLCLSMNYYAVY